MAPNTPVDGVKCEVNNIDPGSRPLWDLRRLDFPGRV